MAVIYRDDSFRESIGIKKCPTRKQLPNFLKTYPFNILKNRIKVWKLSLNLDITPVHIVPLLCRKAFTLARKARTEAMWSGG